MARATSTPGADGAITGRCAAGARTHTVLVGIRHRLMRRWTIDLLRAEYSSWAVTEPGGDEMLVDAIDRSQPDLVVVDSSDFPACCVAALRALPPERLVVVGPEPDAAYQQWALAQGAGGWVSRDHLADELSAALRGALGRAHPDPPAGSDPQPSIPCPVTDGGSQQ